MDLLNTGPTALESAQQELENVVQRATKDASAQVITWQMTKLNGGRETVSTLYRFDIEVKVSATGQQLMLPLVLKMVRKTPDRAAPSHWNYWLREAEAYASGTLANLPAGLEAPTCYGVTQQEEVVWFWLEYNPAYPFTESDARTVCYNLGRFSGAYLAGTPLPHGEWAIPHWLRQHFQAMAATVQQLPNLQPHPLVGRAVAPHLLPDLMRLIDDSEGWLHRLEQLPQVFCHQDAHRGNLFLRHISQDDSSLAAVDWSYSGIAAVGQELAPILFTGRRIPDIYRIATHHYIDGLRAVGWRGDENDVLWSSAVATALNYGVAMVGFFLGNLLDEREHADLAEGFGVPVEQLPPRATGWVEYGIQYANIARTLVV